MCLSYWVLVSVCGNCGILFFVFIHSSCLLNWRRVFGLWRENTNKVFRVLTSERTAHTKISWGFSGAKLLAFSPQSSYWFPIPPPDDTAMRQRRKRAELRGSGILPIGRPIQVARRRALIGRESEVREEWLRGRVARSFFHESERPGRRSCQGTALVSRVGVDKWRYDSWLINARREESPTWQRYEGGSRLLIIYF